MKDPHSLFVLIIENKKLKEVYYKGIGLLLTTSFSSFNGVTSGVDDR